MFIVKWSANRCGLLLCLPRPSVRVQSIQHQLAQLDSESWSGRAEADRDLDFMQLLREKEALLQEIILVSKQQHPPETLLQLEEERSRLEEEVQRAHSSQSQGANQRWELWWRALRTGVSLGWITDFFFLLRISHLSACTSWQDPAAGEEEHPAQTAGGSNTHHYLP